MDLPSKEAAPCPSPSRRVGGRHSRHLRGVLPRCDERPSRGRPEHRLRRRDAGSRRWHLTDTYKHCLGRLRGLKPRRIPTILKGGRRGPLRARPPPGHNVSTQSRTCFELHGGPIAQFEEVWLLGPTFVRLPAQAFYVKKAVVPIVAQMAPAYSAGGGGSD